MKRIHSGDFLTVNCVGMNTWSIRVEGMAHEATRIVFEGTLDGSNWSPLQAREGLDPSSGTKSTAFVGGSPTIHRWFNGTCHGLRYVRMRAEAVAEGDHIFARGQVAAEGAPQQNPYADLSTPWSLEGRRSGKVKLPGVLEYDDIRAKEKAGDSTGKRIARSRAGKSVPVASADPS